MYAVIGGTGIYQMDGLEILSESQLETPFGNPSGPIVKGQYGQNTLLFLPRHGKTHSLLPHEVNYRANIWALKSLGATACIGVSAVGSLREEIAPGDLSVPDQYFDFVKGHREKSFFGNGIAAHVSTAQPTSQPLTKLITQAAQGKGIDLHTGKTYACVDGPRLGTKAESLFLKNAANADLVGMTNVPEVFLAREAQLAYATLCIATDYDCWKEDPEQHVTVEQVIQRYGASLEKAKSVLAELFSNPLAEIECESRSALTCALLTQEEALNKSQLDLLEVLKR